MVKIIDMPQFKVTGYVRIEVKTIVEADNEDEANKIASDREVSICIHGTEDSDAHDDWVYVDAPDLVTPDDIEPYD